jgi:heparan-alpha-glucosaminide N-acetyltransferase
VTKDPARSVPSGRSTGVDALRGLVVLFLLVLVHVPSTGWRGHAVWYGTRWSDLFFPAFLFVAGVGLALQTRRGMPWGRLLRRFVTLVVLGLFVNAWTSGDGADLSSLRIPGVLQRIALVGLAGAVVAAVVVRRRWWVALVCAGALAFAWAGVLAAASSSCEDGRPQPDGCGTLYEVDSGVFGESHTYHSGAFGHDPEGLPSSIGALATFLVGFGVGLLVAERRLVHVVAVGAGALAAWPVLSVLQPLNKRLWTGSFVAFNAFWCCLLLAALMWALDGRRWASWTWPVEALARNTLVVWTGIFLTQPILQRTTIDGVALGPWALDAWGAWGYLAAFGGGWWLVACAMHAARWHVRL